MKQELDAAERRARAFASARIRRPPKSGNWNQRLDHEKTRDKAGSGGGNTWKALPTRSPRWLPSCGLGCRTSSRLWKVFRFFPALLSFADLNLARIFPHNVALGRWGYCEWVILNCGSATIRAFAQEIRDGRRSFELGETATQIAQGRVASDNNVWTAIAAGTRRLLKTCLDTEWPAFSFVGHVGRRRAALHERGRSVALHSMNRRRARGPSCVRDAISGLTRI